MTTETAATRPDLADDLLRFVDAAPSPFHAVAEMGRRLAETGFTTLDERQHWSLEPGDRRFVVRDGGSIVAFVVGATPVPDAGFRLVGAHTDSPTLKVRPVPDVRRAGYRLVGVEPYGGALLHTWLDRDLTLAGRVAVGGTAVPSRFAPSTCRGRACGCRRWRSTCSASCARRG